MPTYKRLDCLRLSLLSVLNNELPPNEPCRLVLSNNYPPHRQDVEDIVSTLRGHTNFSKWEIIYNHQIQTVPAVDNWYQTILNFGKEDEMVVLHGDDDLLTPESLKHRFELIQAADCDFILSGVLGNLTFVDKNRIYYAGRFSAKGPSVVEELNFDNFEKFGNVFIGNHTYKNTSKFKEAIVKVKEWTEAQQWIDYSTRNLMFPYYLILALLYIGARGIGSSIQGCFRGTSLDEKLNAPFNASYGWNSGLLSLIMLDVLDNDDLKKLPLNQTRQLVANDTMNWYFTMFLDRRVDQKIRKIACSKVHLSMKWSNYIFNLKVIFKHYFGLKAYNLRREIRKNKDVYLVKDFMNRVYSGPQ